MILIRQSYRIKVCGLFVRFAGASECSCCMVCSRVTECTHRYFIHRDVDNAADHNDKIEEVPPINKIILQKKSRINI